MAGSAESVERLADHFVNYLFDRYRGNRHVRRVASWVGFVVTAIARVSPGQVKLNRERQLTFTYARRRFKVRYNHKAGARGGIEVVEVLRGAGSPDGAVVVQATKLTEAESLYAELPELLDKFVASSTK